jgi:hypothetical protein
MVDSAIWCDFFVNHDVSQRDAARATAYLFKVPEGDAKDVDPGFFHQMGQLEEVLEKACGQNLDGEKILKQDDFDLISLGVLKGIISEEQATQLRGLARK